MNLENYVVVISFMKRSHTYYVSAGDSIQAELDALGEFNTNVYKTLNEVERELYLSDILSGPVVIECNCY